MKKFPVLALAICLVTFSGCHKEKLIQLETHSVNLYHNETYKIPAECENPITYSVDDAYHATVSQNGTVTANHVGGTTIHLESEDDSQQFTVYVQAKSNLYPKPNINFGQHKSSLPTPTTSNESSYFYTNYAPKAPYMLVSFDETDRVENYAVLVDFEYTEELETYLDERYEYIGYLGESYSDMTFFYMDALTIEDAETVVAFRSFSYSYYLYWMVVYFDKDDYIDKTETPVLDETRQELSCHLKLQDLNPKP